MSLIRAFIACYVVGRAVGSGLGLYSDSSCQELITVVPGSHECTALTQTFGSFKPDRVDGGCAVTVYGSENAFCGTSDRWVATGCNTNTTVNQFTIDCIGSSSSVTGTAAATSTTSSTSATDQATTTGGEASDTSAPQPTSANSGLSTENKIQLGVGIGVGVGLGLPGAIAAIIALKDRRNRRSDSHL